ncbi:hypothetical protein PR003_g12490 [Phytophthora rubi]|uniref:Uncharacterized protein n=1 Tax=Phytophthora rubi TaxID=129364 RepID=A0A6A4F4Y5_9STRA|nr:hypothetical protein PR002_g12314 [Phytophthora rubi]KAE9041059.1 hypothetical protein PR001_g6791 [Phytophthora rubi]KAE9336483.1 hypothetical protein PR003_g12490 [Phytophthora rubi]
MTDIYGGRVLAGEDSEEDDEDEEEMSFQFNGFGSQASPAAPRFAVPTVVAPPAGAGGEEDEEELQLKLEEKAPQVEKQVTGEEEEEDEDQEQEHEQEVTEKTKESDAKKTTEVISKKVEEPLQELWQVDGNVNGIEVMSNAFVDTVQPSLDATIHRIAELKESQLRLLKLLTEQNAGIKSNKQLEDAAVVLEKLPFYVKKLQGIKLAMQEISVSSEKMKRRAEGLRIDAQSYAIKKENKRDAQSQWNKLYAAKSAPSPGAQS